METDGQNDLPATDGPAADAAQPRDEAVPETAVPPTPDAPVPDSQPAPQLPGYPPAAPQWPGQQQWPGYPPAAPQWPGYPPAAPQWPGQQQWPGYPPAAPQWPGYPPAAPQWPGQQQWPGYPPPAPQWPAPVPPPATPAPMPAPVTYIPAPTEYQGPVFGEDGVPRPPGRVVVIQAGRAATYEIQVGGQLRIGRAPGADLVLPEPWVSPFHALVERRGPSWIVSGLDPANPTFLLDGTGRPRPIGMELGLHAGTLLVGSTQILLYPPVG